MATKSKLCKLIYEAHKLYRVSVPGSMMLFGEHAVLNGKQAVVAAVNKRLNVQLIPNNNKSITITDTRLGTITQPISAIEICEPFKFVLAAIQAFQNKLISGFTLQINSEFSSVLGLGSSAAVTVATIAVIGQWLHSAPLTAAQVFTLSKQVMLQVQGFGSGADLAASIYGGVLGYKIKPYKYCKLPFDATLTAIYCGYKTPTPQVIKLVNEAKQQQPDRYKQIFSKMHICSLRAIQALRRGDRQQLGKLFLLHHTLQQELGVSDSLLDFIVQQLSAQSEISGAKISGSGLGDCVIGLGELSSEIFSTIAGIQQFVIQIEPKGLVYEPKEVKVYANN